MGERSGLIIGPGGTDYSVTSSASDTVAVEQVLTFWAAVAKVEGSAEITASNSVKFYAQPNNSQGGPSGKLDGLSS